MSDDKSIQKSLDTLNSFILNNKTSCTQDELLHMLSNVTDTLVATRDKTANELAAINQRMATIEANVNNMQRDIATLCKLVRDGNGQPSLLQRLNTVEIHIEAHRESIMELNQSAGNIVASRSMTKAQIASGVIAMIITTILSVGAMAISLIKG